MAGAGQLEQTRIRSGPSRPHGCRRLASAGEENKETILVPMERLQELVRAEVHYLASVPLVSVSLREIIDCSEPHRAAELIQEMVPKRLAHRVRMIKSLMGWQNVMELVWIHGKLMDWYTSLRLVQRSDLVEFTACAKRVKTEGADMVRILTTGIWHLKQQTGTKYSDDHLDRWLDNYLVSRIGTNLLLDQFIALSPEAAGGQGKSWGVVDPTCDVFAICEDVKEHVSQLSSLSLGSAPPCILEVYQEGVKGPITEPSMSFSYVPDFLRFITAELLKRSFEATVVSAADQADLESRPVRVLLALEPRQIAVRVRDRAGGIPSDVGKTFWSYTYKRPWPEDASGARSTNLRGPVGLPLSRLYARYLGGDLTVTSLPGYGTDAVLVLPRLSVDMVEKMPGETPM